MSDDGIASNLASVKLRMVKDKVFKRNKAKKVVRNDMGTRRAVMVAVAFHKLSSVSDDPNLLQLCRLQDCHKFSFINPEAVKTCGIQPLKDFLNDFDMVGKLPTAYDECDELNWEQFRYYFQLVSSFVGNDGKFEKDVVDTFSITPAEVGEYLTRRRQEAQASLPPVGAPAMGNSSSPSKTQTQTITSITANQAQAGGAAASPLYQQRPSSPSVQLQSARNAPSPSPSTSRRSATSSSSSKQQVRGGGREQNDHFGLTDGPHYDSTSVFGSRQTSREDLNLNLNVNNVSSSSSSGAQQRRTPKPPSESHKNSSKPASTRLARSNSRDSTGSAVSLLGMAVPGAVAGDKGAESGSSSARRRSGSGSRGGIERERERENEQRDGYREGGGFGNGKKGIEIPPGMMTASLSSMDSLVKFGEAAAAGLVDSEKVKHVVLAQQKHIVSLQQAYHSSLQENAALKDEIEDLTRRLEAAVRGRDDDNNVKNKNATPRGKEQEKEKEKEKESKAAVRLSASAAAAMRRAVTTAEPDFSGAKSEEDRDTVGLSVEGSGSATCRSCGQRCRGDIRGWAEEGASLLDSFEMLLAAKQDALDAQNKVITAQSVLMTQVIQRATSELRTMPAFSLSDATADAVAAVTGATATATAASAASVVSTKSSTTTRLRYAAKTAAAANDDVSDDDGGANDSTGLARQGSVESIQTTSNSVVLCLPIGMDPTLLAAKRALAAQREASRAADAEAAALEAAASILLDNSNSSNNYGGGGSGGGGGGIRTPRAGGDTTKTANSSKSKNKSTVEAAAAASAAVGYGSTSSGRNRDNDELGSKFGGDCYNNDYNEDSPSNIILTHSQIQQTQTQARRYSKSLSSSSVSLPVSVSVVPDAHSNSDINSSSSIAAASSSSMKRGEIARRNSMTTNTNNAIATAIAIATDIVGNLSTNRTADMNMNMSRSNITTTTAASAAAAGAHTKPKVAGKQKHHHQHSNSIHAARALAFEEDPGDSDLSSVDSDL